MQALTNRDMSDARGSRSITVQSSHVITRDQELYEMSFFRFAQFCCKYHLHHALNRLRRMLSYKCTMSRHPCNHMTTGLQPFRNLYLERVEIENECLLTYHTLWVWLQRGMNLDVQKC